MEKAVSRVADINKWRAEQEITANKELASKVDVVREYKPTPELPNPQGLRWVEIKPKDSSSEARADLEKQLKYEGSTMQHCVGGYCEDVASGNSRIFSLRDAKGEPHVTIETSKPRGSSDGQYADDLFNMAVDRAEAAGVNIDDPKNLKPFLDQVQSETHAPTIVQIKGKQNKKPADQYLPFVQDFVRNSPHGGQWSEVQDIEHTDLIDAGEFFGGREQGLITKKEAKAILDRYEKDPQKYGFQPNTSFAEMRKALK
jgi:hypothetical protein